MGKVELILGHDDKIYLFFYDKCVEIYELNDIGKATYDFQTYVLGF